MSSSSSFIADWKPCFKSALLIHLILCLVILINHISVCCARSLDSFEIFIRKSCRLYCMSTTLKFFCSFSEFVPICIFKKQGFKPCSYLVSLGRTLITTTLFVNYTKYTVATQYIFPVNTFILTLFNKNKHISLSYRNNTDKKVIKIQFLLLKFNLSSL
ncbi:hypothetical protein SLUG_22180 [Staphylococcus lugdunensis N920143]|nr:hypothetical protein SLUG_22180 [Staphylococcus lugdunensis N920143]